MKRRTLLQLTGLGLATGGCGGSAPAADSPAVPVDAPKVRPNILMIAIDDLNDWVGFLGGHPQTKTPNMDALAGRSTVFSRAYCNGPVCWSSRPSALSGLSIQSTGVYDSSQSWASVNPGKPVFDQILGRAGYTTRRFGKVDHNYSPFPQPMPPQPYANKVCYSSLGSGAFDWGPAPGTDEQQPDYLYAQQGIDFLNAQGEQPFCLSVGLVRTHVGWYVPQRFFDMHPLEGLVLPAAPTDDLEDLGPGGREVALKWNFHDCIVGQDLWAEAVRAYLASISWVDTQVGRLLAALDKSPHAKNTIVVLWSDNGFHLGQKFHWHKMALWEPATRVPFLIRLPGQGAGFTLPACVSLRDMAPTLLDYTGVAPAYPMDGASLRPLLLNPAASWDRPVLMTKDHDDHAIRTSRWRYIRYASGEKELYDEVADAGEYHNLASDPAYAGVIAELDGYMPRRV